MKINKLIAPSCEDEIKSNWKYKDKVYISCVCITFNHDKYISDAIDSMLAQVTDYRFEIIIHDDLSTDKTRDILIDYKRRYPSIIKLILQDENQYSKGKKITQLAVEHAKGEYIALCEGDDFWLDYRKLQQQYCALEESPNIDICFTSSLSFEKETKYGYIADYFEHEYVFSLSEVIRGGGQFMPTPSIMLRKVIISTMPEWYIQAPVGDLYVQIIGAIKGGALFLPLISSVYRINSINSWSEQQDNISQDKMIASIKGHNIAISGLTEMVPNNNVKDCNYLLSDVYFKMSIKSILKNNVPLFHEYIVKSWSLYKRINYRQILVYLFKNHVHYLIFAHKMKHKLLR